MKRIFASLLLAAIPLFAAADPTYAPQAVASNSTPKPENPKLKMSTTTSTENSGLLKYLLPLFTKDTGYEVQVLAEGTGKALKMGEMGDVDVVLVHARKAEDKFVADGFGDKRYGVMYNDFVVLGPKDDPAGVNAAKTTAESFQKIAAKQAPFVSRGDDSGTHKKELEIWKDAAIKPAGAWYRSAGRGMGEVIQMSGELSAYTLADRGTWVATEAKSPLKIVFEGEKGLYNPYGIIAVSTKRYPDVNAKGAQALITWITSEKGQKAIGDFKVNDKVLFIPNAGKE